MGVYTTTRCGYCNDKWEDMEWGSHPSIGPPFIKCRKCGGLNKTKQVLYRDASLGRKISFWFGQGLTALIYGVGAVGLGIGMLSSMESYRWIAFFPIIFGMFQLYQLSQQKKDAKALEDSFDKNGGFVWSDEGF